MSFLLEKCLPLKNNDLNAAQLDRAYVATAGEPDWLKPKFTLTVTSAHMDVRWFHSFIRIEMKTPI